MFKDLRDHIDAHFPEDRTKQRRSYDVVNILTVVGVVKREGKWLTYNPYLLEGSEAAEAQC